MKTIAVSPGITLYHRGPSLDHGPLPSFFYFCISGKDTLSLDPFNQPVQFLHGQMIRVFSLTLPGHENDLPPKEAMKVWAENLEKNKDLFLKNFIEEIQTALDFAIQEKFADPLKLACGGLSRGAFIAAHLAAQDERFQHLLGFAPLTKLGKLKEFPSPYNGQLDLDHLAPLLADRHIRLYIGNDDTQVGTKECFDFASAVVKEKKKGTSHVELFMYPSIGKNGHGTPPEIFQEGARWIINMFSNQLLHGTRIKVL